MNPIHAARSGVIALAALTLGGCYYTSPYGYAPYYTSVPATVTQRETAVSPATPGPAVASPNAASGTAPGDADVAPAYPPPYPYYYPAYYPGWYGPPVAIGFGFWGGWGGGYWRGHGGRWGRPWGGGHWGGGHRH
ncbi:hypothetical protein [Burkholderia pseudomultivorans]|uniref:Lipoprotein n=1 Tax=Burkholderia pseudomultivorans TaxID=1207504 RepID=A0ABU2DZK7_9BURK|nr:hypothetical protein [Burkholderia pseudomultivorans]MDR8729227.1 hypothetical protein [Burkholderia pseudomultivorans]MDR8732662.1 hypothetical protein [Burkholderia pseudomultivorans]MDR8739528.1 hypothetical protein [Burkholderia pseudomultivorans]MDR8752854.1 hypothetical protein [Burkholderia pseudomultivorans]MDR8778141.1 hypothetical protein [Burkholderia pseudomultivorans]